MKQIEVALHRESAGGSIRVVVDGGRPGYLTEPEVRDRLQRQPRLDAERLEDIVRNLNTGHGTHMLRYAHPNRQRAGEVLALWAGADRPVEAE